jgi:hypothetical protein
MTWLRFLMAGLLAVVGWACVEQEPDRPTEEDVRIIKQSILTQAPAMKLKVDADLEGKVTYLGLDVDKDVIQPGTPFKLTHYWKCNKTVSDWEIFVHLNGPNKADFINADHKAIGGRYPAGRWKEGEIIRDEHSITLPANWKHPKVMVYVGMWKGRLRMKIKGPQDDEGRVLAATLPVSVKAGAIQTKRLTAIRVAKPIKIDGKLDDEAWSKAPSSGPFVDTLSGGPTPKKTEVKAAWDDSFLYFAFHCEDDDVWSTLKKRDDKLWTEEAVEVFIDANADGKDYIELQVNPHNAVFDSYLPTYRANQNDWNSKIKTAVVVDGTVDKHDDKDKGWTVEMAIPWADTKGKGTYELKLPPAVGSVFRVNFFRMDLPFKTKAQVASGWSPPLVADFHKVDRFGELVFGDEQGKTPVKKEPAKKEEKKAEEKKAETPADTPAVGNVVRLNLPAKIAAQHRLNRKAIRPIAKPEAKKP